MSPEAAAAIRGLTAELNALNNELKKQSQASRRRLFSVVVAAALYGASVLSVGGLMLLGLSVVEDNQADIKLLGELQLTESLRRERDVLDHRIKQEDCVVRPINEVIEKRINTRVDEPIELCDPEPAIAQLQAERMTLERVIAEREAMYHQQEEMP